MFSLSEFERSVTEDALLPRYELPLNCFQVLSRRGDPSSKIDRSIPLVLASSATATESSARVLPRRGLSLGI